MCKKQQDVFKRNGCPKLEKTVKDQINQVDLLNACTHDALAVLCQEPAVRKPCKQKQTLLIVNFFFAAVEESHVSVQEPLGGNAHWNLRWIELQSSPRFHSSFDHIQERYSHQRLEIPSQTTVKREFRKETFEY